MASGKTGGIQSSLGIVDGMNLMPPPRECLSYVEKAAILEETIARERTTEKRLARESSSNGAFHVNPYNRGDHFSLWSIHVLSDMIKMVILSQLFPKRANSVFPANHQFVAGKILGREETTRADRPNLEFAAATQRTDRPATEKFELPQTSSQEIGWFTKTLTVTDFKKDPRVNHPLRHSISGYMASFWKYYPSDPNLLRGATNPSGSKRQ